MLHKFLWNLDKDWNSIGFVTSFLNDSSYVRFWKFFEVFFFFLEFLWVLILDIGFIGSCLRFLKIARNAFGILLDAWRVVLACLKIFLLDSPLWISTHHTRFFKDWLSIFENLWNLNIVRYFIEILVGSNILLSIIRNSYGIVGTSFKFTRARMSWEALLKFLGSLWG